MTIRVRVRCWSVGSILCVTMMMALGRGADLRGADRRAAQPPNIILILADDLGAKELACYGHATHQTPHLDRMAAEGVRFETFFAMPLCTPTDGTVVCGVASRAKGT